MVIGRIGGENGVLVGHAGQVQQSPGGIN
jgi:hypothetical protein